MKPSHLSVFSLTSFRNGVWQSLSTHTWNVRSSRSARRWIGKQHKRKRPRPWPEPFVSVV